MKQLILLAAAMATIGLASCSKEDLSQQGKTVTGGTPLAVSSASLSTMITKANVDKNSAGNKIGVFQLLGTGYSEDLAEYDYAGGWAANTTTPMAPVYLNNNNCIVIGFYPWGAAGITKTNATTHTSPTAIAITSQKYDPAQDLCYQIVQNVNNQNSTASFIMQHVYARLSFRISKDAASYAGTGNIQQIKVGVTTGSNVNTSCPINLTSDDGTVTGIQKIYGTAVAGQVVVGDGTTALNTSALPSASGSPSTVYFEQPILMVPVTSITGTVTLAFKVDGTTLNGTIPSTSLSALKPGSDYVVNVLIQGTTLKVMGVQVVDWGADSGYTPVNVTPAP